MSRKARKEVRKADGPTSGKYRHAQNANHSFRVWMSRHNKAAKKAQKQNPDDTTKE